MVTVYLHTDAGTNWSYDIILKWRSPIQKKPSGDDDDDNSSNGGSGSSKKLKSSSSSDDLSTTVNLKGVSYFTGIIWESRIFDLYFSFGHSAFHI